MNKDGDSLGLELLQRGGEGDGVFLGGFPFLLMASLPFSSLAILLLYLCSAMVL